MSDCYNCGAAGSVLAHDEVRMICSQCGAWIARLDTSTELAQLYSEKYFQGEEYIDYESGVTVHALNFRRKISLLKKSLPELSSVRLLEIGSASGEFLLEARKQGLTNSIGIEISEYARDKAIARGLKVFDPSDKSLVEIIRELRPNVIVMWDVWEHLPRPSEVLKIYLGASEADCLVAITTVDAGSAVAKKRQTKWRQFHPPTHINYPTGTSFEKLFESLNFRIIERNYFGYYRPLAEYLVAALGKAKWILKSRILFRIPLYLNLYDTQMIIAKRGK